MRVISPRPALVPLTFTDALKGFCAGLSGLSVEEARVGCGKTRFSEGLLFSHRGLTGPSILQISSYWAEGQPISIDFAPGEDIAPALPPPNSHIRVRISNGTGPLYAQRLAAEICTFNNIGGRLADLPNKGLEKLGALINNWQIKPAGTRVIAPPR